MNGEAVQSRSPDKLLAIGAYGETVAAYRYLILSEKAPTEDQRRAFAAMSDEEQDHKQRLQDLIANHYPHTDFVLTTEDKDLVVTGPRLLDIRDIAAYVDAMRMILETEQKTAGFYAQNGRHFPESRIRDLFHELAEEGADHFQRLCVLAKKSGIESV